MDWGAVLQAGAQIADKTIPYVIDNHWKHRQIAEQERFARNQIQWRVEDAKQAGIHPLYALGASTFSPNLDLVGGQASGGFGFSDAFDTVTNSKFNKELQAQTLEKNQLEIDGLKLRNQIAYLQSVKPVREMGQSPLGSSNVTPSQGIDPSAGNLSKEIEPRYALSPVEMNPNLFKVGPSTQSWLQDAISEVGIATIPEQILYFLNHVSGITGMSEYRQLADIFNYLNSRMGKKSRWFVHNDYLYGPVLVEDIPGNKYNYDYYYGKGGRRVSPRDYISDVWDDSSRSGVLGSYRRNKESQMKRAYIRRAWLKGPYYGE